MDSRGCILGLCVQMSCARNKPGVRQEEAGSAARGLCMVASPCSGVPHEVGPRLGPARASQGWAGSFKLLGRRGLCS